MKPTVLKVLSSCSSFWRPSPMKAYPFRPSPQFSGRFNKGVDYVGDVARFEREFALDVAAIDYAVKHLACRQISS